jgi:hypothetical protein
MPPLLSSYARQQLSQHQGQRTDIRHPIRTALTLRSLAPGAAPPPENRLLSNTVRLPSPAFMQAKSARSELFAAVALFARRTTIRSSAQAL